MENQEYKETLKEMIAFLEKLENWLSYVHVQPEEEKGRGDRLRQTREAKNKFKKELEECN